MNQAYDLDLFEDKKLAESFICIICQEVPGLGEIVDHGKCGAIFCYHCITEWLKKKQVCPKCKEIFGKITLSKDHSKFLHNLICGLKIKCPNSCSWVGEFKDLGQHLINEEAKSKSYNCPYQIIGCEIIGTKDFIENHLIENTKEHLMKFQEYVKAKELEKLNEINKRKLAESKKEVIFPGTLTSTKILSRGSNPVVYLEICINNNYKGYLILHLFQNIVPKTVKNFLHFCNNDPPTKDVIKGTYRESLIHRIIPGFIIQGGDIINYDRTQGRSIYGGYFPDENFELKHDSEGDRKGVV